MANQRRRPRPLQHQRLAPTRASTPSSTATPTPVPSPTATVAPTPTPEPPQAPDFSLSTGTDERYSLDDLLTGRDALVIVFYRSYGLRPSASSNWSSCRASTTSLRTGTSGLRQSARTRLSMQSRWRRWRGRSFPILADTNADVSRDFGVFNLLGDGVAAPATFHRPSRMAGWYGRMLGWISGIGCRRQ